MAAPWEQYQTQTESAGPWAKYRSGIPGPPPTEGEVSSISALWEGLKEGVGNIGTGAIRLGARLPGMPTEAVDTAAAERQQRFEQSPAVRQHPYMARGGEIGGEMLGSAPAALVRTAGAALPVVGQAAKATGTGIEALWGALMGAGAGGVGAAATASSEHFGRDVGKGMLVGAPIGAAGGAAGSMLTRSPNPAAAARLADFEAQGVTPSVPVVGQGPVASRTAQASRVLPFSPVQQRIEQNVGEAAGAAERAASQYGVAAADEGGSIAQNALRRYAGDTKASEGLYKQFWGLMQGAPNAPVTRTLQALDAIRGRFPNAPELKDIWPGSTQLGTMQRALEPRTVNIPAKTSGILGPTGQPIVTQPAQTVQRGGVLSISELKELKTKIGSMLESSAAPMGETSIPRAQLKMLYGSVKGDLMDAAARQGPPAVKALVQADSSFSMRMNILDRIAPLLEKGTPEGVWSALDRAAAERRGDAGLLRTAKRIMAPDDWNNVGAAVVRRLGQMPASAPRLPGQQEFSVNAFANNWRKMSDKAKDVVFGADVYGSPRSGLEQLYRVTSDLQHAARLGGRSESYNLFATGSALGGIFTSIMMGHVPLAETGGLAGAYGLSKALMSPRIARWLYKMPQFFKPGSSAAEMRDAAISGLIGGSSAEAGRDIAKPGDRGPLGGTVTNAVRVQPPRPRAPDPEYIEPPGR